MNGHCLCKTIRFSCEEPFRWRGHCHCESCRRQTASPFTSFFGVADGRWRWTASAPAEYRSSPGVTRFFCPRCGAPVAYRSERYPDEIHFYAALLTDHSGFRPEHHDHWSERVAWVSLDDELPRRD